MFIKRALFFLLVCSLLIIPTSFAFAQEKTSSDANVAANRTLYGFFPSPPQLTIESVFKHYEDLGKYGDFVLFQHNVPWLDFVGGVDGTSQTRTDIINQQTLAQQNGLASIYVVDGLNGLNRREFKGLPEGWEASFANPDVRAAYTNYTLWVVQTFHPQYLGLGSEVNTYMDAYPSDAANFVSLYHEIYALVKAEAPDTQVFVTFQWEDLNDLWPQPEEGEQTPFSPKWEKVEVFEPNLDLWVISSYPYFIFPSAADLPADYYSRLLMRTSKPVAVAEGGWTSIDLGPIHATPADQVGYLNAIRDQLGERLAFWTYLLLNDLDLDSYLAAMQGQGVSVADMQTLSLFASIGLREMNGAPKPGIIHWMNFRAADSCPTPLPPPALDATSRSFHMGFTRWPPEATLDGIALMNVFLEQHGDLAAIHFDGGVPWNEALRGKPLPASVVNEWRDARDAVPAGHKLYVAITPINMNRNGLAPYWGSSQNQPLPRPWNRYAFDNTYVKKAYLNYARRVIEYFHPDYLAIGIEVNVVQVNAPKAWPAYKRLQQYVYTSLKKQYPDLPIFVTFSVNHMNGLDGGNTATQTREIQSLLRYTDLMALSAYPYGWAYENGKADPIPENYFDVALSFGKPIAVAESGAPSDNFSAFGTDYEFSEAYQTSWIQFLLQQAQAHQFEFVINWTGIDFDKLLEIFPPETRELGMFWAYDGLERSNGCAKQALPIWDQRLALPYQK